MSAELVVVADDGTPTTTSLIIAQGTEVQHKNVLELVRLNLMDFEEFGRVAFETRPFETAGGTQHREVAVLNEEHATLLLTYMRNSDVVRGFKKALVREFWMLRRGAALDLSDPLAAIEAANARSQQAVEIAKSERAARIEAQAHAKALEAPAAAWTELVDAAGDYEVGDAAKVLSRDDSIKIGRDRLFAFMAAEGWIYRGHARRWRAYQTQVDRGRLAEKIGRPYWCDTLEKLVTPDPTVRVTAKGLAELHKRLGGGRQLALMAATS